MFTRGLAYRLMAEGWWDVRGRISLLTPKKAFIISTTFFGADGRHYAD